MEALHDLYLESWAHERWFELRRVAAREAQIRTLRSCWVAPKWQHKVVAFMGGWLVALGARLEALGRAPLPAAR